MSALCVPTFRLHRGIAAPISRFKNLKCDIAMIRLAATIQQMAMFVRM